MSAVKGKIAAARNDSTLLSRWFIACQIHNSDLDEFLKYKNQVFPSSLCYTGNLHFTCKYDLMSYIEAICLFESGVTFVEAKIIDGSVVNLSI